MDSSHEGIPQSSVRGPLLFACYVNDMPENITSTAYICSQITPKCTATSRHTSTEQSYSHTLRTGAGNGSYASTLTSVKCFTSDETTTTMSTTWTETPVLRYDWPQTSETWSSANRPRPELSSTDMLRLWQAKQTGCVDVRHDMTSVHIQGRRHHQELSYTLTLIRPILEYGNAAWVPSLKGNNSK